MKNSEIRPGSYRKTQHLIETLILERWSPRAMSGEAVETGQLMRLFQAARWAPSPANGQPWFYLFTTRDRADWPLFYGLLDAGNQEWCHKAWALVVVLAEAVRPNGRPNRLAGFSSGLSVQNLLLQGHALGLVTHPMAGFYPEKVAETLGTPPEYDPQIMIAIGQPGKIPELSARNQAREYPSQRKALSEIVRKGGF